MNDKQVGDFHVSVSDPSPVWIEVRHRGGNYFRFDSRDLPDLIYAAQWALRVADEKLSR